ncbi:DUF4339 domain-containing protein [Luteolibacter ambystomatis]|uniref:DUF4339 domain-containing protein n=1 Tax=Luteolibacter ambystomatis TaxID=2824561 RepID=A0A975IZ63_9BACT|nr:DUF4339 domain-containing protein [Luteolibacter ambystomatis]QUE51136.1 DUF4339 domain-containing protein [Luteolibacter ambystomatis]
MSDVPQDAWFFSKDGKQYGPVGMEELRFVASQGQLHPRQDLVWRHGMEQWTPAGEIEGLFEKVVAVPEAAVILAPPINLEVPTDEEEAARELMAHQKDWVGVSRIGYPIGIILVLLGAYLVTKYLVPFAAPLIKDAPQSLLAIPVLTVLGLVVLSVKRLRNVGMSGWWLLGALVPFLGLWVGYRAVACPGGYQFHRKMDGVGIFLAILYWLGVLCLVLLVVVVVLAIFGALGDPEFQQKMKEAIEEGQRQAAARRPAP